ncbi:MAG: family 10 glycosylhydrolase [Candidatus Marinimicrobia bacterium]|nr:family 10 glycosylhydrolase [Candidatus Neomarinimicrobiota bacterium]
MKKNSKTVLALITGILFLTLATIPVTLFSQAQQEEGRAVWLHASIFEDEEKEATQHLKELLNKYDKIGINNIFCFYTMMDQHQKKWDFLKVLLKEAHQRNIKIHSIFCPGQRVKLEGKIMEHPEWLIRGKKGEIYPNLNLANPEAREYLKRKVQEALKYDIDGIHLDYIRFPVNQRFSYDKTTCESFKKEYGYSPLEVKHDCGSMVWSEWIKWNAKHVTALVKEIKETINKSGRNVVLGVDVFPDHVTAQVLIGQDWELWAKEGIVDFICPMLYTNDTDLFRRFVKEAVKAADGKCLVYPGIACRSSHNKNTPEGVAQEVKIAREAGADGVVFFSGFSLNEEFINKLKLEVFKEK